MSLFQLFEFISTSFSADPHPHPIQAQGSSSRLCTPQETCFPLIPMASDESPSQNLLITKSPLILL
nr:hypothetical protein [uncultured bacterium]